MIIDSILLILGILAFIRGWRKGLLWALCSLIAVFLGIIIAMKLSYVVAEFLFVQNILTNKFTMIIAFVVLFLLTIYVFRLAVKFIETLLDKMFLGWVNKLLGGLFYTYFMVFIMSTFCWLANEIHLLKPTLKSESKSYIYLEPIAPKTIHCLSSFLPYCKNLINEAQQHLEKASSK